MTSNRKPLIAVAIALLTGSGAASVVAEVVNTTDGNFTVIESTAPLGIPGTYAGGGDGLIGVASSWPVAGTPAGAASNYDHQWLQGDPGIIWQFRSAASTVFAIPGVDHGPIPQENLEFIIWGSNDGQTWEEGKIQAIYRDGFDTADTEVGHSDDYTSKWGFTQPYSMVMATSGDHLDPHYGSTGEFEIDGVARGRTVPDVNSTGLLLGVGLLSLACFRRKVLAAA